MKKCILALAVFCLALPSLKAQLADGSIAPDFTATDINGVEHNLYELLDAGKSVVLDVSATWCPPCWSYHVGGELETVWEEFGPDGTDEMYVFMIEGDGTTGMDDLQGTTSATAGNWIEGTQYPIIDDAAIAQAYQISYFPTVYHICPDKTLTEIGQVSADAHHAAHGACAAWINGVNNASAGSYSGTTEIACGADTDVTPKFTIRNLGSADLTSCTVEFLMNGTSMETQDWTGSLATLETDEITFANVTVASAAELSFVLSNPNGMSDDNEADNVRVTSLGSQQMGVEVTFEITTDFWPEEITWELKDENGMVLYSDADEGTLTCDETYTQVYTLEEDKCYTFSIVDSYGDGILNGPINPGAHSCTTDNGAANQAMGAISFSSSAGVVFDAIDYGGGTDIEFLVATPNSTKELDLNELSVYPNPANDFVSLSFDLEEASQLGITVYNMLGQTVTSVTTQNYGAGSNIVDINTTSLANGMYFVNISDGTATVTKKLTISK